MAYARTRRVAGAGWDRIAGELGIAPVTLRNWASSATSPAFEQIEMEEAVASPSTAFVAVVDERSRVRVEGVPLEHVADLVRRLR